MLEANRPQGTVRECVASRPEHVGRRSPRRICGKSTGAGVDLRPPAKSKPDCGAAARQLSHNVLWRSSA